MLIIYGKKTKLVAQGYVADYCPLCRKICSFRLNEVRVVTHIYYIGIGSGEPSGYEKECLSCSSSFAADRSLYRPSLNPGLPLDKLEKQTFPELREVYAEELELEEKIKRGELGPDDRISALCQTIGAECYNYEKFLTDGAFVPNDLKFGCLVPLALMFISFFGIMMFEKSVLGSFFAGVFMLAGFGGFLTYVILRLSARRRYARNISAARIAAGFRPVGPDLREIKAALSRFSGNGTTVVKYLSAELLMDQLHKLPAWRKAPQKLANRKPAG